jgi:hypothetical protein
MAPVLYYAFATFVASNLLIGFVCLATGFDPGVNEMQAEP